MPNPSLDAPRIEYGILAVTPLAAMGRLLSLDP
jgi:hypothetical protein